MKYSITIMTPQEKTSLEKFIDFISEYHIIFCVLVFIIFLGIFITSIYKNSNLKKFILENKKILFLFLLFPFIFFPLIFISGEKFTLDGWFGFIGGYFGIIGAVGAVWWQLNEEKKREKEEIIFSRNEALYSFLTFTCEKSSKFYTLCEVYLRNIINGNTTIFPKEIFLYEKEILLNIFETSDVRIKKYIVLISHSFSEFMLAA